jgi:hypothetical protein
MQTDYVDGFEIDEDYYDSINKLNTQELIESVIHLAFSSHSQNVACHLVLNPRNSLLSFSLGGFFFLSWLQKRFEIKRFLALRFNLFLCFYFFYAFQTLHCTISHDTHTPFLNPSRTHAYTGSLIDHSLMHARTCFVACRLLKEPPKNSKGDQIPLVLDIFYPFCQRCLGHQRSFVKVIAKGSNPHPRPFPLPIHSH